jgi:hypothetical protein
MSVRPPVDSSIVWANRDVRVALGANRPLPSPPKQEPKSVVRRIATGTIKTLGVGVLEGAAEVKAYPTLWLAAPFVEHLGENARQWHGTTQALRRNP